MRYKPEHKQNIRARIVESAVTEFKSRGFEGVGIPALMGTLSLTHGGFYAHFADKEALVAEASALALQQSLDTILHTLQTGGIPAMLDYYLSAGHRDNPALGCPLPALTAEVARHTPAAQQAFTGKLAEVFSAVAEYMPGQTPIQKQAEVHVLFAALTGAVALARAVSDPTLSDAILASAREQMLCLLAEKG